MGGPDQNGMGLTEELLGKMIENYSDPAKWGYFSEETYMARRKLAAQEERDEETIRHRKVTEKETADYHRRMEGQAGERIAGATAGRAAVHGRWLEDKETAKGTAAAKKIDNDLKIVRGQFEKVRSGDVEFAEGSPEDKVSQGGKLNTVEALALDLVREEGYFPEDAYRRAFEIVAADSSAPSE
jgi:hypothetical protein